MTIKDLEGRSFEITDIDGTISMIDLFLSYIRNESLPSLQRLEDRRVQYWKDLQQKLLAMKSCFNAKS